MSIPGTTLPNWGGALGAIAKAIANVAKAHEESTSTDARVSVQEGGNGEKLIGLTSDDDGGNGDLPGGYVDVVTGAEADLSVVEGRKLKLKLTLHKSRVTLEPDGTLSEESIASEDVVAEIEGSSCEDSGGEGSGGEE